MGSHFPVWSRVVCSNWKTMLSSLPSGLAYSLAVSTVELHASPTVTSVSSLNASRLISWMYPWRRGPLQVILLSGSLPMLSTTSRRKPPTPLSTQKRIISYSSRRMAGFSQFKSGCQGEN